MSKLVIGTIGVQAVLTLRQGMSFGPHRVLIKADGVAVDVTGSTIRGHIRETVASASYVPFDIVLVNSSTVSFTFGLEQDVSDELVRNALNSALESAYVFDLEWFDGAVMRPLFYGELRVRRRVTRV